MSIDLSAAITVAADVVMNVRDRYPRSSMDADSVEVADAAIRAAAPLIEAAVREQVRDAAMTVLQQHGIECTGVGEVSCRGCRDRGWMAWMDYREHLADLIARGERP